MSAVRWNMGWGSYHGAGSHRRHFPDEGLSKMIALSFLIHLLFFSFLLWSRPFRVGRSSALQSYHVTLVSPEPAHPPSAVEARPTQPVPIPSPNPMTRNAPITAPPLYQKGKPSPSEDPERLQEWWKKKAGSIRIAPTPPKAPVPSFQPAPRLDLTQRAAPSKPTEPKPVSPTPKESFPPAEKPAPRDRTEKETGASSIIATGSASIDKALFQFPYYLQGIENKISGQWVAPPVSFQEEGGMGAIVLFHVRRTGIIESVEIEKSSGNSFFDQAALRAVYASNPFPPFPDGLTEDPLRIHFSFTVKKGS